MCRPSTCCSLERIVGNSTIKMKLFVLISTVLLLSAIESVPPETSLVSYVQYIIETRKVLKEVSSKIDSLDAGVNKLTLKFAENITDLRRRYGVRKFEYYHTKYEGRYSELNNSCPEYAQNIVRRSNRYQTVLSNSIIEALNYWSKAYKELNSLNLHARAALFSNEKIAHECGKSLNGREHTAASSCALSAYIRASDLGTITLTYPYDSQYELDILNERKNEALEKLYENLEDLFNFYDAELMIDDWFNENCPGIT